MELLWLFSNSLCLAPNPISLTPECPNDWLATSLTVGFHRNGLSDPLLSWNHVRMNAGTLNSSVLEIGEREAQERCGDLV